MKSIIFKSVCIICFSLLSIPAIPQSITECMSKVRETYSKMESYKCDITVSIYAKNSSEPKLFIGSVFWDRKNYYSNIMNIVELRNKKYHLYVNKNLKYIQYSNSVAIPKDNIISAQLDSVLSKLATVSVKSLSKDRITYQIDYKDNNFIRSTSITINLSKNILERVIYNYGNLYPDTEKVIVDYSNPRINESIPETDFSELMYIKIVDGKVLPAKPYSDFRILKKTDSQ